MLSLLQAIINTGDVLIFTLVEASVCASVLTLKTSFVIQLLESPRLTGCPLNFVLNARM